MNKEINNGSIKEFKDLIQDQLARVNEAINTDCPKCDYQCQGCIRSVDDFENMKIRLEKYKGET